MPRKFGLCFDAGHAGCAGQSGYTPLHYAARAGPQDAVTMLLDAGTVSTLLS